MLQLRNDKGIQIQSMAEEYCYIGLVLFDPREWIYMFRSLQL